MTDKDLKFELQAISFKLMELAKSANDNSAIQDKILNADNELREAIARK